MGAVRTAIGKYGGSLKSVPAHELGALVIREALSRAGIEGTAVDEVILGEVRQSTEASNIARCALLEAGLPETVPGFTVNRLCASAMQAVLCGCQEIWLDQAGVGHQRLLKLDISGRRLYPFRYRKRKRALSLTPTSFLVPELPWKCWPS